MTRYSTKPLSERLGLKHGQRLYFEGAPLIYLDALGPAPSGVRFLEKPDGPIDFIHLFVRTRQELAERVPQLAKQLSPRGKLWVSWPRQRMLSGSDIADDDIREIGVLCGLSGVKSCDINDAWIGQQFVYPRRGRPRSTGYAAAREPQTEKKPERRSNLLASGAYY